MLLYTLGVRLAINRCDFFIPVLVQSSFLVRVVHSACIMDTEQFINSIYEEQAIWNNGK